MGFEDDLTQFAGPGAQRPIRPVPAKIDYAVSRLGDDAGRWFLVVIVADPWVLEYRANVVFHLGTHLLISRLLDRPTRPATTHVTSNIHKLPELLANRH